MADVFDLPPVGSLSDFPVGTRVRITERFVDHHIFRIGETGTVVRHAGHDYLGLIVGLDQPFRCSHGHYTHTVEEFNFSPCDVEADR